MKALLLALFVALNALVSPFAAATSVVFLNPGRHDERYWVDYSRFMQAAAASLGIQLRVLYAERNPQQMVEQARGVLLGSQRPDFLLFSNEQACGPEILRLFRDSSVHLFAVNNGLTGDQQSIVGNSRERYANWIGSLVANDEEAGYQLATTLIQQLPPGSEERGVDMIAFSGLRVTPVAQLRESGLRRALAEHPKVHLKLIVRGNWERQRSHEQAIQAFRRYPETRLVWAANDDMALGAMQALRDRGGKPGIDVLYGAFNNSDEALHAYLDGQISALVAGQFSLGGWAMVMLNDYAAGVDFASHGGKDRTAAILQVLTKAQAQTLLRNSAKPGYGVSFKQLSMTRSKVGGDYRFGLAPLLE